jgi:hypothetical protein
MTAARSGGYGWCYGGKRNLIKIKNRELVLELVEKKIIKKSVS